MRANERYRYAEYCLYGYSRNVETYERLRKELDIMRSTSDVKCQNYELHSQSGTNSSPVERYVEGIERLEVKTSRLANRIRPVEELQAELTNKQSKHRTKQKMLILEEYYIGEKSAVEVQRQYRIPRWKFYVLRQEVVHRAMYYIQHGLVKDE